MQDGEKNYQYHKVQKLKKEYARLIESKAREQERYKEYYDRKHKQVDFTLVEEVMVLFDVPTKGPLMPRWEGPFTITRKLDEVIFRVQDSCKITTVHVQRMLRYRK
jgi:hypothetical protein